MNTVSHRDRGLELIALFRMMKAVLLILAGAGVLSLLQPEYAEDVHQWLSELTTRHEQQIFQRALRLFDSVTPVQIQTVGVASILYGLLFATEGIGLWLEKRWAEFLTVFTTGALIPFEIYELSRRVTALRALALLANVAAVAYLVYRLRHPNAEQRERSEHAGRSMPAKE